MAENKWKGHPDYRDGYADVLDGAPVARTTEPYMAGREAGLRAAKLLADHGFTQRGHSFTKRISRG